MCGFLSVSFKVQNQPSYVVCRREFSQKAQGNSGCVVFCLSPSKCKIRHPMWFAEENSPKKQFSCQNLIYSISILSPNSVIPLPCPVLLFLLEGGQRALKKQWLCHKYICSALMSCPHASSLSRGIDSSFMFCCLLCSTARLSKISQLA